MQAGEIGFRHQPRSGIDQAERADTASILQDERGAGIEPDPRLMQHQRVVGKTPVLKGIRDDHRLPVADHVRAEGGIPRGLRDLEPVARLEPLPVLIDQADQCDGNVEERGGETRDPVKPVLERGIENLERAQRG